MTSSKLPPSSDRRQTTAGTEATPRVHSARSTVLAGAIAVMTLAGCGPDRPGTLAWKSTWEATSEPIIAELAAVDTPAELDQTSCDVLVEAGRFTRSELVPTPTGQLDKRVHEWADLVESVGVGCRTMRDLQAITDDIVKLTGEIDGLIENELPTR